MNLFRDFPLEPSLLQALDALGYQHPTEIQAKTLPILLQKQTVDFHGQAQTGTGKTLAFGLPLIQHVDTTTNQTQALVVAPTRELAVQIQQQLQAAAKIKKVSIVALYGGLDINEQLRTLRQGAQIIIGTPGRLLDHLRRKSIQLNTIKTVVLDEADIMLDMGFRDEIEEILRFTPKSRAVWLFSATIKPGIAQMMQRHMRNPISISVSKQQMTNSKTEQFFAIAHNTKRFSALCRIIETATDFYGFIFCPTKVMTAELADRLKAAGYKAHALHGDMPQTKRNKVITAFKKKEFSILVATDVAARGIDVPDITHVINYGLPEDQENYIHRIGRTGRAGKEGIAITLLDQRHLYPLQNLAKRYRFIINELPIPTMDDIVHQKMFSIGKELETYIEKNKTIPYQQQLSALINSFTPEQQKAIAQQFIYEKWLHTFMSDTEAHQKTDGQPSGRPRFRKRRRPRRF